jgi:hypothetical protein
VLLNIISALGKLINSSDSRTFLNNINFHFVFSFITIHFIKTHFKNLNSFTKFSIRDVQ